MPKKTVLVVDDEQGFRDLLTYLLEPLGLEVTCVVNGQEAVDAVQKESYDLIFMDVHMPRLPGPKAVQKIKEMYPSQKIIIFSSSSDPKYLLENSSLREGAIEVLYKPVEADIIISMVQKVIGPL